jgi:superfamily II DNA or RNA helicase
MEAMTETRRLFNKGERQAIARSHGYRCARCGIHTFTGHSDHATSFANGGLTTLANAQYLCAPCNQAKGADNAPVMRIEPAAKPSLDGVHLRPWQREVVNLQIDAIKAGASTYFIAAGVGSGKTLAALALYLQGDFDLIVAVTPRSGIRGSWHSDAQNLGIRLESILSASAFTADGLGEMPHGFVVNIQGLGSLTNEMRLLCAKYRVLAVFDEAHHLGADMPWTQSAVEALGTAAFSVGLSGTPFRTDSSRIYLLDYTAKGERATAKPDYTRQVHESVAAGECAAVVSRFVSGEVTKEYASINSTEVFSFSDGDYSADTGTPDAARMSERLRLAAVMSTDWQMGAVREARAALMAMRADGNPWGGLIGCATIDQATALRDRIEKEYGDECLLIVADVDTETAVAEFNADESYVWAISITKIAEGVSIKRLRVGLMLTNTLARGNFEQFKGRLMRLYGSIPSVSQTAELFLAADPRLMDMAIASNETMLHNIPWLAQGTDDVEDDDVVIRYEESVQEAQIGLHGEERPEGEVIHTRKEDVIRLREELQRKRESMIIDIGSFTLRARAWLDGAVVGDEFIEEQEYLALRRDLAQHVRARTVVKMPPAMLKLIKGVE